MPPWLLALLSARGYDSAGSTGLFNTYHGGLDNETIKNDIAKVRGEKSPMERIMGAFDAYKEKKGDRTMVSPQERINNAFNVPFAPEGMGMREMAQAAPMNVGQPQMPPSGPGVDLPRPAAYEPQGEAGLPPMEEQIPWWKRNAMMMREGPGGAFLDPAAAARAQGIFGG